MGAPVGLVQEAILQGPDQKNLVRLVGVGSLVYLWASLLGGCFGAFPPQRRPGAAWSRSALSEKSLSRKPPLQKLLR